jgi:hypothetical protein
LRCTHVLHCAMVSTRNLEYHRRARCYCYSPASCQFQNSVFTQVWWLGSIYKLLRHQAGHHCTHKQLNQQSRKFDANALPVLMSPRILSRFQNTEALQKSNVPAPLRVPWRSQYRRIYCQRPHRRTVPHAIISTTVSESQTVCQTILTESTRSSRKRRADSESATLHVSKIAKR